MDEEESGSSSSGEIQAHQGVDMSFVRHMQRDAELRDAWAHKRIQDDMIEEILARSEN